MHLFLIISFSLFVLEVFCFIEPNINLLILIVRYHAYLYFMILWSILAYVLIALIFIRCLMTLLLLLLALKNQNYLLRIHLIIVPNLLLELKLLKAHFSQPIFHLDPKYITAFSSLFMFHNEFLKLLLFLIFL